MVLINVSLSYMLNIYLLALKKADNLTNIRIYQLFTESFDSRFTRSYEAEQTDLIFVVSHIFQHTDCKRMVHSSWYQPYTSEKQEKSFRIDL